MSRSPKSTRSSPAATLVVVRNCQRLKRLDVPSLEGLAAEAAQILGRPAEVCFHLVSPREMARVNWQFLQHEGSTDVITFDQGSSESVLRGEIFISVADAVAQAEEFGTTWQDELSRYVVHGLLHLAGYDDLQPPDRRIMKRQEERLLRRLRKSRPLKTLGIG